MTVISITDTSHSSHLVEELVAFRQAGELFDYTIQGHEQPFPIHSVVLAAVSPMFKAMVCNKMHESSSKEASFPSIPDDIMAIIIDFAYSGNGSFDGEHLMELVTAAHYLRMAKLLRLCEEQIEVAAAPSNCFSWMRLADKLELSFLATKVQRMLRSWYTEIIQTDEYAELEIAQLEQYLIDVRKHGTSSDNLTRGVLQWIKHDVENRSVYVAKLFTTAHIGKCSNTFLLKMIEEHAELLDLQAGMYKMMLAEILNASKPNILGRDKTILLLGGMSVSAFMGDIANTDSWILKDDKMVKFNKLRQTFQPRHSICQIPSGLMLTGGFGSNTCMIFVFSLDLWVKQQSMQYARNSHGSGYIRGKVFVISGNIPTEQVSQSVDVMDLKEKTWSNGPPLPSGELASKVITFQSTLYVLFSKSCQMYELDMDKMCWATKAPLPTPSRGCSVAASQHRIFAAGGDNNINYMYNPGADVWCKLTGPTLTERQGSMVYYEHKLYLFPGCKRDENLTDVEEYDIDVDTWSLTEWKMPVPLWKHEAFLVDLPQ